MAVEIVSITLSALRKPNDDLYGQPQGTVKIELNELRANQKLKLLHKAVTSIQKVKTMWKLDKAVNLLDFYYPSRVIVDDKGTSR